MNIFLYFFKKFNLFGRKWSVLFSSGCRRLKPFRRELGKLKIALQETNVLHGLKCYLKFFFLRDYL
jgi:hypothetical protein